MRSLVVLFLMMFGVIFNAMGSNDPDLKKGWEHFSKNEFRKAEISFKKALTGSNKADAHLALSILGAATDNDEMALEHQYQFFKSATKPEPYIEAMWNMWGAHNMATYLAFMTELTKSPDGKLQAKAHQALGHQYYSMNKVPKSQEMFAKTGAVLQWQVLGEFENVSESGFDKDFGAVAHPEMRYNFRNKWGAEVNWIDIKAAGKANWIDLDNYYVGTNSVMYAQTFCNSTKEQEVQFRMGTSGSLKVWVNDRLMYQESEERDNNVDTYLFTVKLMKGYNRILIQIGSSEVEDANFLLRITDSKGMPIEGLTYSASRKPYAQNYTFNSQVIESPTEKYLTRKIADNPDDLKYYIMLTSFYLAKQDAFKAKKILKAAREKYPDCSYLIFQLLHAHSQDNNRTEFSKALEEIKAKDPESPLALSEFFDEAVSIKNYREAQTILDKIERKNPNSSEVYSKKIELALANEEYEKLIELVMEAYKRYPNNYEFVELRVAVETQVRNNSRGGIKILQKYLKKNLNESAIDDLAELYLETGMLPQAIALLNKRFTRNPLAVGTYKELSQIYFYTGNYSKALDYANECLKIAPYIASYHVLVGEALAEMKKTSQAKEAYEKAIYYNPQNYDAREKLRKLAGLDDIFDTFEKIDVYEAIKKAPKASDYPEDNSIILIETRQVVVYPGGGSQEKMTLVAMPLNVKGVDSWKEFNVPVYSNQRAIIEKMEVIKKNGSKIEAQRSGSQIIFPNLEEGDAIHVTWKVSNHYSSILARNYWSMHYLGYMVPLIHSSFSLLAPRDWEFKYQTRNIDLEPVVKNVDANKLYVWKVENQPAIKDERYMPPLTEVGPVLHISSFDNWTTISQWYADLAHAKAKVDFEITETVQSIFEGKGNLTDEQKVQEIYAYIVRNIRYSSVPFLQSALIPRKASRTLSQKQGDCKDVSTLFVAMCKAVGIDAQLVLISSRRNGTNRLPLPSIGFNHAIAKVVLNNKEYYVELTSDNLPFAAGMESVKLAFALDIPKDRDATSEAFMLNPPTRIKNDLIRKTTVKFNDDLMLVSKENWRTGVEAAYYRDLYKDLGTERQEKKMQEAITGSYPKIKLTSLKFDETLNNLEDTLTFSLGFEVPSIFTEIGKMLIFELPWSDKFDNPPFMATDERKLPIELWRYLDVEKYEEEITVEIPAGKKLTEVPKNVILSCPNADYSLTYRRVGNTLVIKRTLIIKVDHVSPEQYVEFKKFIGDVVKADKRQIGFSI